jgi:hypothetical protein
MKFSDGNCGGIWCVVVVDPAYVYFGALNSRRSKTDIADCGK